MKKLFQKINTRGMRSVLLGLVLAFGLSFAGSFMVGAATQIPGVPDVQPFIGESTTLMSRIGSLAIGRASISTNNPIKTNAECFDNPYHPSANQTCLDVFGGATFANLLINQTGYFNADTVVGVTAGFGEPGGGGFSIDNSTLTIENNGTNSGFLISGLGYHLNGIFAPRNLTTAAEVCASANGTLQRCTGSNTTYSWQVGVWGACTGVVAPSCNGSYQTTNGGVCEGSWQSPGPGSCSGTYYTTEPGDPNGSHTSNPARYVTYEGKDCEIYDDGGSWQLNCQSPSPDEFCHNSVVQVCDYEQIQIPQNCSVYNNNKTGCQNETGCTWNLGQPITNYCSPATNQQACIARNPACNWNPNTTTVSCTGPTTQNECTSQNPACTFNPGNPGNHSRTVTCRSSTGQTVADQICIDQVSPKPAVTEPCS